MRFLSLILFLFFFWHIDIYSQEITVVRSSEKQSLRTILEAFKDQYQFSFSYDADTIKDIALSIDGDLITIASLQKIIESQTTYLLQKVSETDFILVKNDKMVNVCGVVVDAVSKFELPQADIIQHNKTIDLTDNKGFFELQLHPWDSIAISYLGYKNKTIRISNRTNSCDTISLQPEIQNLGQVLVKEYLTGGIQKNQDASVNISTKKLRILPGLVEPDVLQSLQLLPGISSPTEDPAGLYIRGGTPGQNLVLWDGIKMYHNGHFFNQISTFNPFITKNVTVYRGGTSVRYGDRISGVVAIESDDDLTDKFQAGGGLNFTHVDAYIKVPLSKKVGFMLAGRRSTTDIYQNIAYNNLVRKVFQNTRSNIPDSGEEETPDERTRTDDFSFSDSNFKFLWEPNKKNTIKLSSIFAENRLDNDKTVRVPAANIEADVKDVLKIRNFGLSLHWDKKYTTDTYQNINFYFSSYDQRYNNIDVRSFNNSSENLIINNTVKDIGAEYTVHFPVTKKQSIDLGYQFTYNETGYETKTILSDDFGTDEGGASINGNGTNHTLYSEYKYKTPKTYINIGLRGSQLSNTKSFFLEPRMFSSYKILDNFTLNTSAELKNQQLNNFNTYNSVFGTIPSLPVADNIWILSNNNFDGEFLEEVPIRVVKSMQFTLGGLYTYKGWNFDVEGYYKKITDVSSLTDLILDLALPDDDDSLIFYGEEERIGFDVLIKKRVQNYRFWAGYSLSKTISSFPLVQGSYFDGNFDQRHTFNFSQTLKVKDFEFALGWNYATGRPFTQIIRDDNDLDGGVIDPRGINSSRFKSYHRLDASVTYRFKIDTSKETNGMIGISLRNIYNRKNTISQGFRDVQDEDFNFYLQGFENKSLRFTPDFVLRFNF